MVSCRAKEGSGSSPVLASSLPTLRPGVIGAPLVLHGRSKVYFPASALTVSHTLVPELGAEMLNVDCTMQ